MRKVAIIGANEAINNLIIKAKEKGYETHVFAWECGDPGEKTADYFYPVDVADKEKILEKCKEIGVCGVASITSDFAVNTVNYVARKLNLIGNSEKTDDVARNKYLMRCALKDADLYTPWFTKVDKNTDLTFMKEHNYPIIVKPTDRWSSKGVSRVDNWEGLQEAVNYAVFESLNGEAIIENFMDGPEYSAECICQDGECTILAITQKTTTGFPNYVETGHKQPADFDERLLDKINNTVKSAVKALDIKNSAAHAEFRIVDNKEIGIIEVGARMGGDCIGTDLVRLSTGYDYVGMVLDVACGNKIDFTKDKHYDEAKVKFIFNQDDYDRMCEIKTSNPERIVRSVVYSTEFNHVVKNSSDRYGYYVIGE